MNVLLNLISITWQLVCGCARKMLIATHLDRKSPAANRAWDMDIILVTDAGELSGEEWQQLFRNAMQ